MTNMRKNLNKKNQKLKINIKMISNKKKLDNKILLKIKNLNNNLMEIKKTKFLKI